MARSDDEGSVGGMSSAGSYNSIPGAFSINWDEIDSIAEESYSVASSVSSASRHRKRRTTTSSHRGSSRRSHGAAPVVNSNPGNNYDSIESGSVHGGGSSGINNSSKEKWIGRTYQKGKFHINPSPRMVAFTKQIIVIAGLCFGAMFGIYSFGSVLSQSGLLSSPSPAKGTGGSGDRLIRRLLEKSAEESNARRWPVSVRDEEGDFEYLPHPANGRVTLSVPRFILRQLDGSMRTLAQGHGLTRKLSGMVGRSTVQGSQNPAVRTIFVGISSYRDWHCRYTLESIFSRARHADRIRVAVVDELDSELDQSCDVPIVPCEEKPDQAMCQYRDQIDVYEMDAKLSVGPTFSKHIVERMYRNEYYALLIECHTTFAKDWDVDIIQQFESTNNDMAIISTYLYDSVGALNDATGKSLRKSRQVICDAAFEEDAVEGVIHMHDSNTKMLRHAYEDQPDVLPAIEDMPQLQPFWSSSFSFSRGHMILSVPYDPYLPLIGPQDEDMSMAIRLFTHGYDFYTPQHNVAFDSAFADRNSRKSFRENERIYGLAYEVSARKKLNRLIGLKDAGMAEDIAADPQELYTIGHVRPLSKFWNAFGIHPGERIVEQKLCNFVTTGQMHRVFQRQLRSDGMGIDYNEIHYRFHELQSNHDGGS